MKQKKHRVKMGISDRIYYAIAVLIVAFVVVITIYPLYFVCVASVSDPTLVLNGKVLFLPKGIQLQGYQRIFQYKNIWSSYLNTVIYTVVGTGLNVVMTMTAAFVLSRRRFYGKQLIMLMIVFTMYFGGGMIPTYLNIRNLHLLDSFWAMILPGAVSAYNLIIARSFMQSSIPHEMQEAAIIDGASYIQFYLKIVLPLSTPVVGVLTLYYAVGHWNSYMDALLYLSSREKYPLQMILREILIQNQFSTADLASMNDTEAMMSAENMKQLLKYGLIVVSSLPMIILYPFLQKFFVKGVMIGSLKD
ncbi:MAG: carbohydrate ABC transporter permease [Lachnospiraceae bacterium]|nr:carbohydrate ABC transporter permease [Lachnospiraceae bacterium]